MSGAWEGPVGNPGWRSGSLRGLRSDVAAVLGAGLAQRRPVEGDAVGVVDEPVEDGVGEGGLADDLVPGLQRQLAGDDGGAAAVALLDDLHRVAALGGCQALGAPIVQDQKVDPGSLAEQPIEATVAARELEVGEEPGQPVIEDGAVGAARGVAERAGEP